MRLQVEVLVPGVNFEPDARRRITVGEQAAVPQRPVHQIAGSGVQHDDLDGHAQLRLNLVGQIEPQSLERPRGSSAKSTARSTSLPGRASPRATLPNRYRSTTPAKRRSK
jgi:hypothetical protein